jgi:hypothetical protein
MTALFALLTYDRGDLIVAALAALTVAGVVVALGALVLLVRERRHRSALPDWKEDPREQALDVGQGHAPQPTEEEAGL